MKLLLDTHTFLWWCANDKQLSQQAKSLIGDGSNDVFFSVVSGWEIAIKSRLGKLPLPDKPEKFLASMLEYHHFQVLPVTLSHVVADYDLPAHHSDPFDRLLISQAKLENLALLSNDAQIKKYELTVLW